MSAAEHNLFYVCGKLSSYCHNKITFQLQQKQILNNILHHLFKADPK
jgi:hypothetical protein